MDKKVNFFLKVLEKRVLYVLFINRTLCDLKVVKTFHQIFFVCVVQFLPFYEVVRKTNQILFDFLFNFLFLHGKHTN